MRTSNLADQLPLELAVGLPAASFQDERSAATWSDDYIKSQIPRFKWFVHTNLGNGIVARSTSWPDAPANSRHMGVSKFDFIVRRNLPDLQGKRILEIGCNCGGISIHMARLGAAEVVGLDSEATWPKWREQAEFVKGALEWRCRAKYNVKYVECDMRQIPNHDFGHFDAVLALNCLYYIDEAAIETLTRHIARISDVFLVQCNTKDHNHLRKRAHPSFMEKALRTNGFPVVKTDWPWDYPWRGVVPRKYHRPLVVGMKSERCLWRPGQR